MNTDQLVANILTRVGEDPASPTYYTAEEALAALNQAQRVFSFLTLCLEKTATLPLAANTSFYNMLATFTDWIAPLRISVNGIRVSRSTYTQLAAGNPSWRAAAGTPVRYAMVGASLLAITPRPSAGGTNLTVTFARMPAKLTGGAGESPEVPEEVHPALEDYSVVRLRVKEGGSELREALPLLGRFFGVVGRVSKYVRERSQSARYDTAPQEFTDEWKQKVIEEFYGRFRAAV